MMSIGARFVGALVSICFLCSPTVAQERIPDTQDISAVFSLISRHPLRTHDADVAAFNPVKRDVLLYGKSGKALKEILRLDVDGNVWAVERVADGYVVAIGEGRGAIGTPIQLWWFSLAGKVVQKVKVFEQRSERSQVTQLQWDDGKLWVTFFDSKYTTKTGYLLPSKAGEWVFHEIVSTRLGTSVDISGERLAIGRPYGDVQGQDGDVLLLKDGRQSILPSYRGVRSLRFFGDRQDPMILIGDGWHQNYGQFAQARLSLLQRDPGSGRYALQLIRRDDTQYEYGKLFPFSMRGKGYVGALGNKKFDVVPLEADKEPTTLYARSKEDSPFDAAYLGCDGSQASFLIMDQGLYLRGFPAVR